MMLPNARTQLPQSEICMLIEGLVQAIACTNQPAYIISNTASGHEQVLFTKLSKYFDTISQMVSLFESQQAYSFSDNLQLFWQACQDIGLERSPVGLVCLNEGETRYLSTYETMNELVNRIRQLLGSDLCKRRKDDRKYEAKKKREAVTRYCNQVLDRYARTVVVRVNLYYYKNARARLRVEKVFEDLDRLMRERERNPIFNYETGYICCVEQGEDMGYHIHAAFFFNGAEVRSDYVKARAIGELWQQITRGHGYCHSSNDDKSIYGDDLGVGTIRRDNSFLRDACIKANHECLECGHCFSAADSN